MLQRVTEIVGVGKFARCRAPGDPLRFAPLTVVWAENARGKTTLAAVLRSLSTANPAPLLARARLSAGGDPLVELRFDDKPVKFDGKAWSPGPCPMHVFDDAFVADNV